MFDGSEGNNWVAQRKDPHSLDWYFLGTDTIIKSLILFYAHCRENTHATTFMRLDIGIQNITLFATGFNRYCE
jgi:hypothetical protein